METYELAHHSADLDEGRAYQQRMRRLNRLESEVNRMRQLGWTSEGWDALSAQTVMAIFLWGE